MNDICIHNYLMRWLFLAINRLKSLDLFDKYTLIHKNYLLNLLEKRPAIVSCIISDYYELSDIERRLYYEIVIIGNDIMESIHNVSLLYECCETNVIKEIYPQINDKIKKLIKIVFAK